MYLVATRILRSWCWRNAVATSSISAMHPHVDPGLRYCDNHIGEAESEALNQHHTAVRIRDHFPHQVFAGDAEMNSAGSELAVISEAER